jgi:restriction system protein
MTLWCVRVGSYGEHESKFLDDSRIYLTWEGLAKDLSKLEIVEEFQAVQKETYPNQSAKAVSQYAGQMRRFVKQIQIGDWVIVPSKGKSVINIGEVLTPYKFDASADDPYYHYRDVKWIGKDIPRSSIDDDLLSSIGGFSTVFQIQRNDAEQRFRAMEKTGWKPMTAVQAITSGAIDDDEESEVNLHELARDQIAKLIMSRFTKHDLTRLIDSILKAQGYTTHVSPPGPDKGVDILAAPGPLGFGSPRLCVQVKSGDMPVDTPTLNQLIGTMQNVHAEQGLLVSWGGFKTSVDKEVAAQFFRVRLWRQETIIDELLAVYERLPEELRAELPLKRVWAVALPDEVD